MREAPDHAHASPADPYWLTLALVAIGAHQVQSFVGSPGERPLRVLFSAVLAALPLSRRLPPRLRGLLWVLVGAGPTFGAFAGHLVPLVRERRVPPGSETAPLNLAGGALLIALGAALMRSQGESEED